MFFYFIFFLHIFFFFFFNDTATTEIYTLSLHDALPICRKLSRYPDVVSGERVRKCGPSRRVEIEPEVFVLKRSEEHTSELQSHSDLVCRLLLEKKKKKKYKNNNHKKRNNTYTYV